MKKIILSILSLALLAGASPALTPGDKAAVFLTLPQGARPTAMGEAFEAVTGDLYSGHWNPAGLADLGGMSFSASMAPTYLDMYYGYLAGGMSFGRNSVALSITHFNYGELAGLDEHAGNETTFEAADLGISASYARRFPKQKLQLGASFKIANESIENESATSFMLDLGAVKKFKRITLGASARNLGPGLKFVDEASGLPVTLGLGMTYYFYDLPLIPALAVEIPLDDVPAVSAGAEYNFAKYLSLRAGLKTERDAGFASWLRFGLGVNAGGVSFDYAMIPAADLGATHMVTLGYRK